MPNYYAHLNFGNRVLAELPNVLSKLLESEMESFQLGCLGPDPLFFYKPLKRSEAWRMAGIIHRNSAMPVMERLRSAVEDDVPMSRGYAAGFICHLALDHVCHAYVEARAARPGEPTHYAMEGEFDRYLTVQDGYPMVYRESLMPKFTQDQIWTAAAAAYENVQPEQIKEAYAFMNFLVGQLAKFYGRFRGRIIDGFSQLASVFNQAYGMAIRKEVAPGCQESNEVLFRLLLESVPIASREIAAFFSAIARNAPLSVWLDRDFKGTPPEDAETGYDEGALAGALPHGESV
ncbi:MAG: zinc dependent phospholipase C family protein [Oscillospiraceae bacterium]|nr:zinc dependent phospholipase C family protein [Oscillospiraceae bacterium]